MYKRWCAAVKIGWNTLLTYEIVYFAFKIKNNHSRYLYDNQTISKQAT